MNVQRLIDSLTEAVAHGLDPNDEVETWDPDAESWFPVSGYTYGGGEPVRLYTDCDDEEEEAKPTKPTPVRERFFFRSYM